MAHEALETYLNDHLAGSVSAIQMLERAVEDHAGTPLGPQLADLLTGIRAAQAELRSVMQRLGYTENPVKKAGAWLAQHAGRLKIGGSGESDLARFELFEALTLGLQGQSKLWRALRAVAVKHPPLDGVDLARLERQAQEHHDLVEAWRLAAAEAAL
ncbi:MAG TPA: hypothetical protein VFT28_01250 [Gemmatimonadales bacterium]|nr:hypothetical protein [Gemmatimonadales bacterium]